MYALTLTANERKQMDWVGGRYAHGHDMYTILQRECESSPDVDWDDESNITYAIPEHVAWCIANLLDESNYDCLSSSFVSKLTAFLDCII